MFQNTKTQRNFPWTEFWISAEWRATEPLVGNTQEPRGPGFITRSSWRGLGWGMVYFLWWHGGSWCRLLVNKPVFVPFHKNVRTEMMDRSLISTARVNVKVLDVLSSFSFQFWPLWHLEFWRLGAWVHRSWSVKEIHDHTAYSYNPVQKIQTWKKVSSVWTLEIFCLFLGSNVGGWGVSLSRFVFINFALPELIRRVDRCVYELWEFIINIGLFDLKQDQKDLINLPLCFRVYNYWVHTRHPTIWKINLGHSWGYNKMSTNWLKTLPVFIGNRFRDSKSEKWGI